MMMRRRAVVNAAFGVTGTTSMMLSFSSGLEVILRVGMSAIQVVLLLRLPKGASRGGVAVTVFVPKIRRECQVERPMARVTGRTAGRLTAEDLKAEEKLRAMMPKAMMPRAMPRAFQRAMPRAMPRATMPRATMPKATMPKASLARAMTARVPKAMMARAARATGKELRTETARATTRVVPRLEA